MIMMPRRSWARHPLVMVSVSIVCLGALGAPAEAAVQPAPPPPQPALSDGQLVVKLEPGASIDPVNRLLGSTTESVLLASRGIYLIRVPVAATNSKPKTDPWPAQADRLVRLLERDPSIEYAEPNSPADSTEGERFHYWPNGGPLCSGTDPSAYIAQASGRGLRLNAAHALATGAGQVVAVLDTGVDVGHPALAGRIAEGGYDYVDDDHDPSEVAAGVDGDGDGRRNEGFGHGTFVAGLVELVAPNARIMPMRVLDPEGRGNVFVVAEAIFDAAAAGADVINLSFGTPGKLHSTVLNEAISAATKQGALVVGAAGNDGTKFQHFPAAAPGVVAVAAMDESTGLLAPFSAHGGWVDVAAPGVDVISALPCGYGKWSGTSMAAPFVSGEGALLGQALPRSKPNDIARRLTDKVVKVHGMDVHGGAIDIVAALGGR